jgi:hypothetical protein
VLGGLAFWRGKGFYSYLLGLSAVFLLLGLAAPVVLRPVRRVWMRVAEAMGWFMTRVILTILFYLGFTPIAVLGRLFGKHFLEMRMDKSRSSYWEPCEKTVRDRASYDKQY